MNALLTFLLFLHSVTCSIVKKPKQWSDDSIPPPTTPTNSPPYPTYRQPSQSWPTDPATWPPTMSPYPTAIPHVITSGSPKKNKLPKWLIIVIAVASVLVLSAIIFGVLMIIRNIKIKKSKYASILATLSESDISKNE